MSSDLPLKIRRDIRDAWTSKDGPLQIAVGDLAKSLGYTVNPEAEWSTLWSSLKDNFPETSTFVPAIARLVTSWYQRLLWRIEQDQYSQWNEELLEALSEAGRGFTSTIWIQPATTTSSTVTSRWDKNSKKFFIDIPKKMNPQFSGIDYDFDRDFEHFLSSAPPSMIEDLASSMERDNGMDDTGDWADIIVETRKPEVPPMTATSSRDQTAIQAPLAKPMRMPGIDTTPRPAELLRTHASHYLIFDGGRIPAYIQCSHEPTLIFLSDYLKKHGKTNLQDTERRQTYKFDLHESSHCHGLRDLLVIDTYLNLSHQTLNPTLILALIEGVLGYKLVENNGNSWIFRHETGFA